MDMVRPLFWPGGQVNPPPEGLGWGEAEGQPKATWSGSPVKKILEFKVSECPYRKPPLVGGD